MRQGRGDGREPARRAAWRQRLRGVLVYGGSATAVLLAAIQLIPLDRSNPPVEGEIRAPTSMARLLRASCYDCHSNETVWPWYSAVAPVAWLVVHDVNEGREALNFSTWDRLDAGQQRKKMREVVEETREGEMPPGLYLLAHPAAAMAPSDREALSEWAGSLAGRTETGEAAAEDDG